MEGRLGEQPRRDRSFRLEDLLACPDCLAEKLEIGPEHVRRPLCGASYESLPGTPLFATPGIPMSSRLLETHHTHPYSEDSLVLNHGSQGGVVLDFGTGLPHPDRYFPHVLLHEAMNYKQTDVVSLTPRLPYRDSNS